MTRLLLTLTVIVCSAISNVQAKTIRALFLGNSYTQVNDLPNIIADMALAGGDTLIFSSNLPGGFTLEGHSTNPTSLSLIAEGNWDFVILQEQSQLPSFPDAQVEADVYPYATILDSLIHVSNPCAKTLFYVTWGRKNGDAANCPGFPPLCTYEGMDSLLQLRYTNMAEMNHAALSPVAMVWRKIRTDHPEIELYSSDESHPSQSGSFAAACSFYSIMFEQAPNASSYNYTLSETEATTIKNVATTIAFDSLDYWKRFLILPKAEFDFTEMGPNTYTFNNTSENAVNYLWDFGDGSFTSFSFSPTHSYSGGEGETTVTLVAIDSCGNTDTFTMTIPVGDASGINENSLEKYISVYPNPTKNTLTIQSEIPFTSVNILDINGKSVFYNKLTSQVSVYTVDLSAFTVGTYFVVISTEDFQNYTQGFIKN